MVNIWIVLAICLIHWIADYSFHTDFKTLGKRKELSRLLLQTLNYSAVWFVAGMFYVYPYDPIWIDDIYGYEISVIKFAFIFPATIFIVHTMTSYLMDECSSRLWEKGQKRLFIASVRGEYLLRLAQLFGIYCLLK